MVAVPVLRTAQALIAGWARSARSRRRPPADRRPCALDALWLALGTLTAVRVPAPARVDRAVAATAMVLAPLAGALVAAPAVAIVLLGARLDAPPLLVAVLAVAAVALGSRGLHLDGLADTADGLAASYDRDRALAVMRRGDTGPAGAATLVLVLLAQVAAVAGIIARSDGPVGPAAAVAVAVIAGRSVLPMACARGIPGARTDGLGVAVAGTVPVVAAAAVVWSRRRLAAAVARPGRARRHAGRAAGRRRVRRRVVLLLRRCVRRSAASPVACWAPASRSRVTFRLVGVGSAVAVADRPGRR